MMQVILICMFFIPYGTREVVRRIRFPYVTLLLVLANVAAFFVEASILYSYGEPGLNDFVEKYAVIPADVTDGTPLELGLLTAMFLHGGILHIVGNMLYL